MINKLLSQESIPLIQRIPAFVLKSHGNVTDVPPSFIKKYSAVISFKVVLEVDPVMEVEPIES